MNEKPKWRDFLAPDIYGMVHIDTEGLSQVLPVEFDEMYAAEMDTYFINKKALVCYECREPIVGPRDLRRYYGNSLHHSCFEKRLDTDSQRISERSLDPYWKMVRKLTISEPNPQYSFEFPPTANQFHHGRDSVNIHSRV